MYRGDDEEPKAAPWGEFLDTAEAAAAKVLATPGRSPFLVTPFPDRAEYVGSSMCISEYFSRQMSRKNAENQTALSI